MKTTISIETMLEVLVPAAIATETDTTAAEKAMEIFRQLSLETAVLN